MPIYEYKCFQCESVYEEYRKVADRLKETTCEKCKSRAVFVISPGPKPTDHLYPYLDTNMDHKPIAITSLAHRRAELKKRGLQETGRKPGGHGQWI